MTIHYRLCRTDEDFVRFTLFFIRHRKDFSADFSLSDTLMHALETIPSSHILLIAGSSDETIGWGMYRYVTADYEPHPEGEIVFVDSVVIGEKYRSSRLFVSGFRQLANHIAAENRHVRTFQFFALQDNPYLTRLYSKFAAIIGQREGYHGVENIFSTEFHNLLKYINYSDN
ncbi:GNAT family N-acetyltransferase [Paenibacillus oenotherae]|uniref:GNAT family N-acetyltransferase n=1 Tax=Paenibacillus oenotherae TaxID=1435645 RepID=A0ABS7D7D9_9BACL|nr:GNAT family N-acetyltransferase [Paenibacillus oenotherae]MBW7475863.1 GNAT family N-acetyltransferase [Paenibacillus oenotherae]